MPPSESPTDSGDGRRLSPASSLRNEAFLSSRSDDLSEIGEPYEQEKMPQGIFNVTGYYLLGMTGRDEISMTANRVFSISVF